MIVRTKSLLGKRAFGFPIFRQLENFKFSDIEVKRPKAENLNPENQLLDAIYSVNPLTKLPDGDLTIFMSKNTSPEIRDFISRNLMRDLTSETVDVARDGLSDDDVIRYSREIDEDIMSYRSRVMSLLKEDRQKVREKK